MAKSRILCTLALVLSIGTLVGAQTELRRARERLQEINEHMKMEAEASRQQGRQTDYTEQDLDRWLLEIQDLINRGLVSVLNRQPRLSGRALENELRDAISPGYRD